MNENENNINKKDNVIATAEPLSSCDAENTVTAPNEEAPVSYKPTRSFGNRQLFAFFSVFVCLLTVILIIAISVAGSQPAPSGTVPDTTVPGTDTERPSITIEDARIKPDIISWANAVADSRYLAHGNSYAPITGDTSVNSEYAILVDSTTGSVVAAKNPDDRILIASMTKIMTLIVACDMIDNMYDVAEIDKDMYATLEAEKYQRAFSASEKVYMIDLLYGMMLWSGCDASYTVACSLSGSEKKFVDAMNAKAAALGLTDTHFTNCYGRDDYRVVSDTETVLYHYSTPRDIAAMLSYALCNPLCEEILSTQIWYYVGKYNEYSTGNSLVWTGLNNSASGTSMKCGNVTILGGKSGSETLAGYCLASFAENKSGKRYILVTANAAKGKQYTDAVAIYKSYAN